MAQRLRRLTFALNARSFHGSSRSLTEKVIFLDEQALRQLGMATEDSMVPLHDLPVSNQDPVVRGSEEADFGRKRIGCVTLPSALVQNVGQLIDKHPDKRLIRTDALRLYDALRSTARFLVDDAPDTPMTRTRGAKKEVDVPEAKVMSYGPREAVAYTAGVMPSSYAAIANVLTELDGRIRSFAPKSVLDYGTGPGTALWAAKETFDSVDTMVGVDLSEDMLRVAEGLATEELGACTTFQRHMTSDPRSNGHDLVISAFTLGDIGSLALQQSTILQLWQQTADVLVLIERGTPVGFSTIARARQWILDHEQDAHVVAPCPHDKPCPLLFSEKADPKQFWCHFSQRVQRPSFLMKTKHSKHNTEDSKYSYVILRKGVRPTAATAEAEDTLETPAYSWPRLIQPPLKKHKHVVMDTCAVNGAIQRMVIPKSQGKIEYRDARKSAWGDAFPHLSKNKIVTRMDAAPEDTPLD